MSSTSAATDAGRAPSCWFIPRVEPRSGGTGSCKTTRGHPGPRAAPHTESEGGQGPVRHTGIGSPGLTWARRADKVVDHRRAAAVAATIRRPLFAGRFPILHPSYADWPSGARPRLVQGRRSGVPWVCVLVEPDKAAVTASAGRWLARRKRFTGCAGARPHWCLAWAWSGCALVHSLLCLVQSALHPASPCQFGPSRPPFLVTLRNLRRCRDARADIAVALAALEADHSSPVTGPFGA